MEKTEYIEINGVKHFFITYEYDEDMPVILYVHGGPGMAETLAGWEMAGYTEHLCSWVFYDQRGAAWESVSRGQFLAIEPSMIDGKEGLVSREGLLKMIDDYVNLEQVRTGDVTVYAAATEYDENGEGQGSIRYFELNNRPQDEIKDILLASSALPFIYTPVQIGDRKYRDGGLTDNLPIEPLYDKGIRHFIVIGLSMDRKIDYDRYPDAEFVYIKPSAEIGDFWNGTLDFTPRGAKVRMNLGYADAKRVLEYSDKDMSDEGVRGAYRITEQGDYDRIIFEYRKENIENQVNDDMDKINSLINRFM